ncbi:DUF262 domain-containing protein [Amycolatopsis halotolerans]|uniref:DUF262 domain-containing protein n=1 Tax=Amycolatopsis halotolerans TaxID=330083 RepID=A0ABV7QRP4_9PSEU
MKISDVVAHARNGDFDVLEFQRIFSRDPAWVRDLIDSASREIPLGALLLWAPKQGHTPQNGRYRTGSAAIWWIVDGQQRTGAVLAALGIRPPWMNEQQWSACGGNTLGVSATMSSDGRAVVAERNQRGPRVLVSDLFQASEMRTMPALIRESGFPATETSVLEFDHFVKAILDAEFPIEWMPGQIDDAFLAFKRRNSRSTQMSLRQEELELSLLATRFGPLLREYVDPALCEAASYHLNKSFTRRRANNVVQRMLPPQQRRGNALRADPDLVQEAAQRLRNTCKCTLRYLHTHGLVHDEIVSTPAIVEVLMTLFDRIPHADTDEFSMRWVTHVVAGNLFFGRPSLFSKSLEAVLGGGNYAEIQALMAALVPAGEPNRITEQHLHPIPLKRSTFGSNGSLYALTAAHPIGTTRDLGDGDLHYPHSDLRLRPLCLDPKRGLLAHYTLMTDHTAEKIASFGGWTYNAIHELKPEDEQLAAHCLPAPPRALSSAEVADWLLENRTPVLAQRINRFLRDVGPLREPPEPMLPFGQ